MPRHDAIPPRGPWNRQLAVMAGGFVWLAAVSYGRLWWTGSLCLETPALPLREDIVLHLLMSPALAALCWAFLGLWRVPPPHAARRRLLAWALGLAAVAAVALPLTSNDVFSNLAYGHMMHVGLDTSRLGPGALAPGDPFRVLVAPRWLDSPCVYGPVTRAIFYLATTAGGVWTSLLIYKLLFLLLAAFIVLVGYRACEASLPEARVPAALVLVAVNPLLLWEVAGQGHNDGLMVLFTLLGLHLLRRDRAWLAATCLMLGILAKLAVIPTLGFVVISRFWRIRERYYGWACAAAGLTVGVLVWRRPDLALTLDAPFAGHDVAARLINSVPHLLFNTARLADSAYAVVVYQVYWAVSLAAVAAVMIRYGRRTTGPQAVVEHSLRTLLLFVLAFSPNLQPWYFTWMVPFAIYSTSESLKQFLVLASAGFLMLYAAPINVTSWALAVVSLCAFLAVLGREPAIAWRAALSADHAARIA